MSRQFNVQGGSASDSVAEAGGGGVAGIFQPGVKALQPGARDRDVYVRILPAFDPRLSPHDQSFRQSVGEYRLRDGQIDSDTKSEAFTPWYLQVIAYTYLGNTKEGILSPLTLKGTGAASLEECACPIHDLYQKARNSDRPDWKALAFAEKEADRRDIALPFQPVHVLFNALWSVGNKGWEQGVFMLKTTGLKHLKTQLCWPARADSAPLDPNWPQYLIGDVTNPNTGLTARVYKSQVGTVETYCAHMTMEDFKATGCQVMAVGPQQLQGRRILGSDETLKLLSYQEIVDWVLYDGFLPRDLVREACGARANVPASDPPTYASASLPQQHALPQHSQAPQGAPPMGRPQHGFGSPPAGLPQQGFGAPQGAPPMGLPQQGFGAPPAGIPQQGFGAPPAPPAQQGLPSWATATAATVAPPPGPLPAEARQTVDPGKRYAVQHEGRQMEGTWQEVVQWFNAAQPPLVGVMARPTDLTQDWQPIERLLGGSAIPLQAAQPSVAQGHSTMAAPSQGQPIVHQFSSAPPASPAAPQLPQHSHNDGDYIPGVDQPQSGPLPGVAFVADAQPVPMSAPVSGTASGPLTPEERARFEQLQAVGPASMGPREVTEFALLSARAGL